MFNKETFSVCATIEVGYLLYGRALTNRLPIYSSSLSDRLFPRFGLGPRPWCEILDLGDFGRWQPYMGNRLRRRLRDLQAIWKAWPPMLARPASKVVRRH